jgi:hypothetical protein
MVLALGYGKEDVFNMVVENVNSTNKWKDSLIIEELRKSAIDATLSSNDLAKVQITLATYLICEDTTNMSKEKLQEPFDICNNILKSDKKSWEAQIAMFYKVLQYGNTGEHRTQIKLAQEALEEIDFDSLEKNQDIVCKEILKLYIPYKGATLKETLQMIEASAWCYIDEPEKAEILVKQVQNVEYREMMQGFINLTRSSMDKKKKNLVNEI